MRGLVIRQTLQHLGFTHARAQMCEPAFHRLRREQPGIEAYRIICLPTFERPYLLRWQRAGESRIAVYKESDGRGGYDLGFVCRDVHYALSPDQWLRMMASLERLYFWNTPTQTTAPGLDGECWAMEAIVGSNYRVVSRWGGGTIESIFRHVLGIITEQDSLRA